MMEKPARRPIVAALCAGALALGAAACGDVERNPAGGSAVASATPAGGTASGAAGGELAAGSRDGKRRHATVKALPGAIHRHHHAQKARGVDSGTDDRESTTAGDKPLDPCTLVSRAEARVILGKRVLAPVTAPQGPTCIYRAARATSDVTLTVESQSLSSITAHSRDLARVKVHGRAGRCVKYGSVMLYVPLAGGRVLNVRAPCPVAARFAARALPRLLR